MSAPGNRGRWSSLQSVDHMPVILEDDAGLPAVPQNVDVKRPHTEGSLNPYPDSAGLHRPLSTCHNHFSLSNRGPDLHGNEKLPSDGKPTWVVRRGGWYRLAFMSLLVIACIIALVVGLTKGLQHRDSNRAGFSDTNTSQTLTFPAGAYAFTVALVNDTAGCTTNPNTFRCYPYTTYNMSHSTSSATFFWTISQTRDNNFTISTVPNPFVPQFTNVSLTLLDGGRQTERLTFDVPMTLAVVPTVALDSSNRATTCYYNYTTLSTTLWTRRPAEYPSNLTTPVSNESASTDFDGWPYAIQVKQSQNSADGAPDCRDDEGNKVGDFAIQGGDGECECAYVNFDLAS